MHHVFLCLKQILENHFLSKEIEEAVETEIGRYKFVIKVNAVLLNQINVCAKCCIKLQ